MSDEQELKLACLHQAGGNLDHAKSLFDWVSGSVRATPASEAPAVSAPNQDKPEQPFNYQHPSKYGTDVPRRCYLEELTPEERTIRDLVDAVERLGAHPLLTATVIQLMKAGESLADWVDIGLRDKAIAALTSEPETHTGDGGEEFLLDEGQQETSPVQSAHDLSVTREVIHLEWTPFSEIAPKVPMPRLGYELQKKYQLASDEWCFRYVPIITKQWFEKRVTQEGDLEIGVGAQISDPERPSVIAEQERVDPLLNPQSPSVDDEVRNQAEGASPEVASEGEAGSNIQKVNITQPAVPEGWTPAAEFQFDGLVKAGERVPVVMALYEDGAECAGDNGIIGAWVFPTRDCRVIAYRILATPPGIIETPAEAERTSDESQAETVNEQTLITDDIPSIPREEIPIGAAVETYTDSGIETVKISGTTYVVDDEPVAEASYAPINSEPASDALMWANGFEADAKAKAEPEQDKRPFWVFGKKELA